MISTVLYIRPTYLSNQIQLRQVSKQLKHEYEQLNRILICQITIS